MTTINMEDTVGLIELRGIYDGWSVAEMKDGTLANRWDEDDRRWAPTQKFIDEMVPA